MRGSSSYYTRIILLLWLTVVLLSSMVSAEISSGGKLLPEGAGPVYDKYFGKPKSSSLLNTQKLTTKTKVSTTKPSATAAAKPPPVETSSTPPPPPVPQKKTKIKKTSTAQLPEKILKTALGVGIGLLAVPVINSAGSALDTHVLTAPPQPKPLPPPPPPSTTATTATSITKKKKTKKSTPAPRGSSIPSEVFNLVKGIVGVGVLSLPAGVSAFGSAPDAIIPALGLITIIGMLSAYGFALIGKVCAYTGANSYREAWTRSVGESTSWIPAWSTTSKTFLACLAFSMVLSDTFSSLLDVSRDTALVGVTICILLPLCLMKNLKSLAPFSLLGVLGMAYTAMAMTIRWLDGSYTMPIDKTEELSGFLAQIPKYARPQFGKRGMSSVFTANSLILVCMLSTAYMSHFNAPKFYIELENNTLPRFNTVVASGFGISIFLMGFITMVGFLTFGRSCDGLVLNNYASGDSWMDGSRTAVAVSLIFSYPLAFTGLRDGIFDCTGVSVSERTPGKQNVMTVLLLMVLTALASVVNDLSFVLAFGGATLGNALTYVYPALMYRAVVKQQKRHNEKAGVTFAMISAGLGILMGVVGANMALTSIGEA